MALEHYGTITELLALQFADLRSTNMELLELGLEVASLLKTRVYDNFLRNALFYQGTLAL